MLFAWLPSSLYIYVGAAPAALQLYTQYQLLSVFFANAMAQASCDTADTAPESIHPAVPQLYLLAIMSAAKAVAWVERLEAFDKLLKDLTEAGTPTQCVESVQVEKLIQSLTKVSMSFEHIERVLSILQSSTLSFESREKLERAANESVSQTTRDDRQKNQDYTALPFYPPKKWWQLLSSYIGDHYIMIADLAISLGCRNPSEQTFGMMTAMSMLACQDASTALSMPQQAKQDLLTAQKKMFRSRVPKSPLYAEKVVALPASPADMQMQYPAIYNAVFVGEEPFGMQPWGHNLTLLADSIKLRRHPSPQLLGSGA